ncbi:retrovirus-related pol polyprotein from transposon TNT 1-94 [Tanacetum coccineum]
MSKGIKQSPLEKDFQDSPDDEEDTRSSYEYLNDLEEEYQGRALLSKSKRFFRKGTQRFSSAKATEQTECQKCGKKGHFARDCWSKASVSSYQSPFQPKPLGSSQHKPELRPTKDIEAKYNKVKAKLSLLSSSASAPKATTVKNKVTPGSVVVTTGSVVVTPGSVVVITGSYRACVCSFVLFVVVLICTSEVFPTSIFSAYLSAIGTDSLVHQFRVPFTSCLLAWSLALKATMFPWISRAIPDYLSILYWTPLGTSSQRRSVLVLENVGYT